MLIREQEGTSTTPKEQRFSRAEIALLAFATLGLLVFTLPNLANFPAPSDDEIWIMSASYKLATHGVFGSDMFRGFWDADRYYLFNMPLHHLVLAGVFKVFGAGIFIGRAVSVVYGIATLVLTYVLARRIGGVGAAVLSLGLLLFLRMNIGYDTGLPLQELSRSMRYDLAPIPFMLAGAILLLKPTTKRVAGAGALFGIGTLLQFFAAFMLPIAGLYLLLESRTWRARIVPVAVLGAAFAIVMLPYGVYALSHYEDFRGQTSTLYRRAELSDPSLYWDSLKREYKRYHLKTDDLQTAITSKPSEKAVLFLVYPASLVYLGWRAYKSRRRGDRLLFLSVLGLPLELTLIEFEKVSFYAIAAFPFVCIGIGVMAWDVLRSIAPYWRTPLSGGKLRASVAAVTVCLLACFLAEGVTVQAKDFRGWSGGTDYDALSEEVHSYIPPGSKVVGATRLWWGLRDTDYLSYYMLFYRTNRLTTEHVTTSGGYLDEVGAQYVVLDTVSRFFLRPVNPELNRYLESHAERIALLQKPWYGTIEIWRIPR
jgi:4-amino-4-deoxy-L-arabinose transferase-like glycosyltransferase